MVFKKTGAELKACRTSWGNPPIIYPKEPNNLAHIFYKTITQISLFPAGLAKQGSPLSLTGKKSSITTYWYIPLYKTLAI